MRITQTRFLIATERVDVLRLAVASLILVAALATGSGRAASQDTTGDGIAGDALAGFAVGVYLLENGHADRAIAPLSEAWDDSGHSPRVGACLARAYYAVRDVARSDRTAEEVLKAEPANLEMLLLRARISYGRRDATAAIGYLESARELGVGSFESERLLASLYLEGGDVQRAIDAVERCVRIDPSIPEIHTLQGELMMEAGRTNEAEAAFRAALELDPGEPRAIEELLKLLESQNRLADALPVLERLVAQPDAPVEARLKLAEAYLSVGKYDDGIRVLEAGRQSGASSNEADLLLGRLYFEAGKLDEAKRVFESLYQKAPNSTELARILGDLCLRTNDAVAARGYFERAIAAGPNDYRNYLSLFFAQDKRVAKDGARVELSGTEASALLQRASDLAPRDDFDAQYMLGLAFSGADSLESARVHFSRANELKPRDRGVMFNLASVHEKRGRFEDAERLLADLHEIAPDDAAVCNFYGYLLAEMSKDLDRAEELVQKAIAQEPKNGFFVDSLGWVYYKRGDFARAVAELERAVHIVGDDPVILEHLGDAYSALSRFPEALAAYRQSSKLQSPSASLLEKIESTKRRAR